ncbi:MAG TPA: DUF4190 domain-containing protein, partial [Verrucomicrobiae bacterium]|nr:DUF4190 domain-containing protein [Verrucomicrobiae bacterium]
MNDQKKQNELAIFSLLVAVSSIFCAPLVLPAIFMGYVARRRIKKYPDLYGGKAFTTATIILSYAVLVAVAILSFWVYPALRKKMGLVPALSQSETASQVGAGQKSQNVDGSCISLKAYINASFTSSISSPKGIKVNTLEALPQGKHLYGGVPFETEGIVQLMGRSLLRWGKKYPNKVPDILIGKNCKRLYLLHGASWVKTPGQEIAKLTLNYTDGTKQDISIVSGKHILDWWGAPQEQEGM